MNPIDGFVLRCQEQIEQLRAAIIVEEGKTQGLSNSNIRHLKNRIKSLEAAIHSYKSPSVKY